MALWLRVDAVEVTEPGRVAVTGDLRRESVQQGDEVEVVGSHQAVPARIAALMRDGQPTRASRGQLTLVLQGPSLEQVQPGWVVASPGHARPVTRLLLDARLLSDEALALHQLVARYNLARPTLAERIEGWRTGAEALRQTQPYAWLKEQLGPPPQQPFELPARDGLEIQLWQGGCALRGTLSEPLSLGRSRSGQVVVTLASAAPVEPDEVFFLVSGWDRNAVVVGQVTVRSILSQSGLVETALPERPPPLHELLGAPQGQGQAPATLEAWLVWADRLLDQGDPRGDLVVAHARGEDPTPLLEAHADALLGRFASELAPYASFDWQLGYWRKATLRWVSSRARSPIALDALVEELLSHPSARFLHELVIESSQRGAEATASWRQAVSALARRARPLRALTLGELSEAHTVREPHGRCQLSPLWGALPELETLRVRCREIDLGARISPSLRRLSLWSLSVARPLQQLPTAGLPGLQELELCSFPEPCAESLQSLRDGRRLPSLVRLDLLSCVSFGQALEPLLGTPLLQRLRVLSLAIRSTAWGDDLGALLAQAEHLAHLTELRLTRVQADDAQWRALRERLPGCKIVWVRLS